MPAVVRLGDICSGHDGFAPRPNDQGSNNVSVNGRPVHRVGDHWIVHCKGDSCHDSSQAAGSSSVNINGRPVARVGDSIACGSVAATGSSNVFVGG